MPLTLDAELFNRALALGRELLFLHTWGERFAEGQTWPDPVVKNLKVVPATPLPDRFVYDGARQVLTVGDGEFGPVPAAVWHYEISGLKVVQSWLGYRMRNRKGRKSSPWTTSPRQRGAAPTPANCCACSTCSPALAAAAGTGRVAG